MRSLALAMALMLSAPTLAQAADAAPAAAPQPVSARDLTVVAGMARYQLSQSVEQLLAHEAPQSAAVFAQALRPGGQASLDPLWPALVGGAVQTRREAGDDGLTLWFNPVFDAGLVVRWRREGGVWRAVDASAVLGESLRQDGQPRPDGVVGWMGGSGEMAGALRGVADATRAAVAANGLEAAFALSGQTRDTVATVALRRAAQGVVALRRVDTLQGYDGAVRRVGRIMVEGDDPDHLLPPQALAALGAIGEDGRLGLRPVAALRRREGVTLIFQSPTAPGVVWLAHLSDGEGGAPARPTSFAAVRTIVPAQEVRP